ncbi:MAG: DUF935 domain-containing protein [Treponema sp.]|jgi:phage gp29-like protein|nr:DUF935 domain-containing protein [Treponema sp.]
MKFFGGKKETRKADKKILTAQIVRDEFERFLSWMPNPDDVAAGTKSSYDVYRDMRTDPRIKSLLNTLKTDALNFPMHLLQGEGVTDEVFQFVREHAVFTSKLYQKAKRILAGLDYGFSVTEAVWEETPDGFFLLDNLVTRKPDRFVFDADWNCHLLRGAEKRPLDDPYKWLMYQHDVDDENPYGTPVLRCVYWPWMFKKAGYEFWLMATEKFSVKTILALFEMTGDEEAVRERASTVASLLQDVVSGSGTAIGNIKDIKEIAASGSVSEFAALVEACDVQIAYGLTGQSVATNNPTKGTQALGTVSAEIFHGDAKGVALELQSILQKAVNWTVELNFGRDAASPTLEFDVERKADFTELMRAIDSGVPVSRSALYDQYKLPRPRNEEDAFIKPEPSEPGFSLADEDRKKKRRPLSIT